MQTLLFSLLVGFICGMIGAVYRFVLAYEKILNWWFKFGDRYERKWFHRPVWGCSKCFAGQLAGWFWLIFEILPAILRHSRHLERLNDFPIHYAQTGGALVLGWLSSICCAIVTALFIGSYLEDKK